MHDTRLGDYLLTILRGSRREMSLGEIHDALSRNRHSRDIRLALAALQRGGLATSRILRRFPKKQAAEVWQAVPTSGSTPPPAPQRIFFMKPPSPGIARPDDTPGTATPCYPPIWGDNSDPRVVRAKAAWEAERNKDPRTVCAPAEARPSPRKKVPVWS